ncbi:MULTISPECIES: XRE family transcriptional regulator [Enterococcus]|uniref:XRE family transcriptional regulator n=1 Tax=Enterococcus TaxID=1350 RepID=UPI0010FF86DC|nr:MULTISPECIES: XRE family transcriptional regulator [Enterococcus]QCT92832.1 XRE family transcriptional regulator [Enterococcus sp. M190262]GMG56853.1 hypothetical protein AH4_02800 [Enterococcus gallinarum]
MDWSNKVYEELSEFEKFKADKLIDLALDSASDYKVNPPNEHDRIVIRDYVRKNLSTLNRIDEHTAPHDKNF